MIRDVTVRCELILCGDIMTFAVKVSARKECEMSTAEAGRA